MGGLLNQNRVRASKNSRSSSRGLSKVYGAGDGPLRCRPRSLVGEFLVLLGPSSSGKSTVLNILGGLDASSSTISFLVGLAHRLNHFPSQLSGGEQQRVAVARAIVKSDEPTAALDFATGRLVLAAIQKVNVELGTTTVVITHDSAITGMADRQPWVKAQSEECPNLAPCRRTRWMQQAQRASAASLSGYSCLSPEKRNTIGQPGLPYY
jgi:ABC-type sugar transport system ATPase subunit